MSRRQSRAVRIDTSSNLPHPPFDLARSAKTDSVQGESQPPYSIPSKVVGIGAIGSESDLGGFSVAEIVEGRENRHVLQSPTPAFRFPKKR